MCVFFFKQKTAYEMRISDWSSDVCSSDLEDVDDLVLQPRGKCGDVDPDGAVRPPDSRLGVPPPFGLQIGIADETAGEEAVEIEEGRLGEALAIAAVDGQDRKSTRLNSSH